MSPAGSRWSKMIPDDSRLDDLRWSQTQMIPVDPYPRYLGSFAWVMSLETIPENKTGWLRFLLFLNKDFVMLPRLLLWFLKWCKHIRGSVTFPDDIKYIFLETIAERKLTDLVFLFLYKDFVMLPKLLLWLLKWMQTCSRQYYVSWCHKIQVFLECQNVLENNSRKNWLSGLFVVFI